MSKPIPATLKAVNKATAALAKATSELDSLKWSGNVGALERARARCRSAQVVETIALEKHKDATGEWA